MNAVGVDARIGDPIVDLILVTEPLTGLRRDVEIGAPSKGMLRDKDRALKLS